MAADFGLTFRLVNAKVDPAVAAERAVAMLREQIERKGMERVVRAIIDSQNEIVADIAADAKVFGAGIARVMTRVKSPASGTTSVSLDSAAKGSLVSSTDSMSSRLKGKTTVEWQALTAQTIRAKQNRMRVRNGGGRRPKGGDTFFVDTGQLQKDLLTYLGDAFAGLIDPKIVVTEGKRKVSVRISLMSTASGSAKAGVTGDSFPGVNAGSPARNESLFVRYLKRAGVRDDKRHPLAYKLENPRGSHRPFLQNSLSFWIANRLPVVLEKSLRKALSKRVKAA
jgi:hypothetical protein